MITFEEDSTLEPSAPETMTPMIDVILSLLAFMMLMINSPQLTMDLDLPDISEATTLAAADNRIVNLQILAQPEQWRIDDQLISSSEQLVLQLKLQVIDNKEPVTTMLSIDQKTVSQRMIETLDILNRLGVKNTQIALEAKDS